MTTTLVRVTADEDLHGMFTKDRVGGGILRRHDWNSLFTHCCDIIVSDNFLSLLLRLIDERDGLLSVMPGFHQ
jgi:hypothetical protein